MRFYPQIDPETGQVLNTEYVVEDTPLLINIKGCGYHPKIDCDVYAESYENITEAGTTFPFIILDLTLGLSSPPTTSIT